MTNAPLYRAIYSSNAAPALDAGQVDAVVASAHRNNPALGLTGVLIYSGQAFLQVLEGPATSVDRMLGVIQADPRHSNMLVLAREDVRDRSFAKWDMAYIGDGDVWTSVARGRPIEDIVAELRDSDLFLRDFLAACRDVL